MWRKFLALSDESAAGTQDDVTATRRPMRMVVSATPTPDRVKPVVLVVCGIHMLLTRPLKDVER